MKKIWMIFLSFCVLLTGCSLQEEKEPLELLEPVSVNVDVAAVIRDEIYSVKAYPAYVAPFTKELSFSVSGTIDTLETAVGDTVEEGQVLATLDVSGLRTQIEDLEYTIADTKKGNEFNNASAQYHVDLLKLELSQLEKEQKAATGDTKEDLQLSIDIKKADLTIAETKLTQMIELQEYKMQKQEQDIAELSEEAGKNTIKAPFSGEIIYIIDIGEKSHVEANHPLIAIADTNNLFIKSEYISENTIKFCNRYYALYDNREYEVSYELMDIKGYLKTVLSGGIPTTSFTFISNDNSFSIGDFASICIVNDYKQDALIVPAKAVYTDAEGKYVYLMEGDTRIRRPVEVGITTDSLVEIVSGLEEGDEVYVQN